jgi:hypothetical protein
VLANGAPALGVERATLADWVGYAAWWVTPLAALIGAHVMAAPIIHTDDTPSAVLAPGNGRTRTGRLWTYVVRCPLSSAG